ncbi:BrnA antitoxin family protein [Komagataeibacter europaeus]|uniref:BrnA antitoxin family protein n=1 Tax=Komagataeibacter europaeus TaxID=33995 RepID=UPI0003820D26|nr:BrnA antitoxin family protein [Komagataeibacter europaeus]
MSAKHTKMDSELLQALRAVEAMPDDQIVTDDEAPEIRDWSHAERGRFYRPRKVQKTVRFDADVVAFFEKDGPGYQTRMNDALREIMNRALRKAPTKTDAGSARSSRCGKTVHA